jgi:sialic acid synthase SpsE
VATRDLTCGEVLVAEDLAVKRPGNGIAPAFAERLVGLTLARDVSSGTVLQWSDLDHGAS